jgi:hypothetical protein
MGDVNGWKKEPLGRLLVRKVLDWWNEPLTYPWPEELNEGVQQPDSALLCHHCFTPQQHPGWFCPECGAATGPYNNCLPYIYIFSIGEVARAGVSSKLKWSILTTAGLILFSLNYTVFAPIYWFRMYRNWKRQRQAAPMTEE